MPLQVVLRPSAKDDRATEWASIFEQPIHLLRRVCGVFLVAETLVSAVSCPLALEVIDEQSTRSKNEVELLRRMRWSGDVVAQFGSCEVLGKTCSVVEATDCSLADLLRTARKETGSAVLPLNKSLPILIEVLRGVRDLDREGIVHSRLSEKEIFMKDGHALVGDLGEARLLLEAEVGFGRLAPFVGFSFRHPPETLAGNPSGASNTVWAVGLVFARMALGYIPTKAAVGRHVESLKAFLAKEGAHEAVYRLLRENFTIEADEGFGALDPVAQNLLTGMLKRDPERRWTADQALVAASTFALQSGLSLPRTRKPKLPPRWWEAALDVESVGRSRRREAPASAGPTEAAPPAWQ
mmetsp:Transcript_16005/g.45550  ORF Transcript_16005/g.45550 Transcript_16005/m.45550 type:complete len:353 (+) Transcript_16005:842-1900(+)